MKTNKTCLGIGLTLLIAGAASVIYNNSSRKQEENMDELDCEQTSFINFLNETVDENTISTRSRFYIYDVMDSMLITNSSKFMKEIKKLNNQLFKDLEKHSDTDSEEFKSAVLNHIRSFLLKHDTEHTKDYIINYDFGREM